MPYTFVVVFHIIRFKKENNIMVLTISSSSFFKKIAVRIFTVGFIAGIIVGFVFPKITQTGSGLSLKFEETFNWALMIYYWIGSFLSGSTFVFFATVLEYFEIDLNLRTEEKKNQEHAIKNNPYYNK